MAGALMSKVWDLFGMDQAEPEEYENENVYDYEEEEEEVTEESSDEKEEDEEEFVFLSEYAAIAELMATIPYGNKTLAEFIKGKWIYLPCCY